MLLLRLALCIAAVACAFCAPLSVLREPNSASNDLDTFVSGLDSEDSGSVLLGSGFANGLSSLLRTGVDEMVGGAPSLPFREVCWLKLTTDYTFLCSRTRRGRTASPSRYARHAQLWYQRRRRRAP